jgi:hypothetical protein
MTMVARVGGLRALALASVIAAAWVASAPSGSAQGQAPGPRRPARDTPAQQQDEKTPSGLIAGRVLAADTGRPVKRARVFASAAELPGGRGILTEDDGTFQIADLPAGRYTVTVSKSGFVSISYGQRRPLQAGTPLQLADGQEIKDVQFRLPRGSVIAGHVTDETGDAMPGVLIRVLRYQYQQGERRLAPAGTAQTDDLGQFRVWGLMPGDYYVDAQSRVNLPFGGPAGGRGRGGQAAIAGLVGRIAGSNVATLFAPDDENQKSYAPTYFPGVTSIAEAQAITLGLGQTVADTDFSLQLVHVAHIGGHVTNPDGSVTTSGNVSLNPETTIAAGGNRVGVNYGSRINWDGTFSISNVPPGRYTLRARGTDGDWAQYATEPVTVANVDIPDISVVLAEGAVITGTVSFPATDAQLPDMSQIRISSVAVEPGSNNSQARVEKDNTFKIVAVPAGAHLIRPTGPLRGWSLKSVVVDGRDITDTPLELRSGQQVSRVAVTFTNQINEINGTLTNEQGMPVTEYTVLAFPMDSSFWRPQSRHIATARPDQTGKFRIRNLPSGSYYLATVDPAEQGEWFEAAYLEEHRLSAARVTLGDGETKTQDFKIRSEK